MRLGLILWNAVTFIYYNWLKCSNTFLECCSLYLSCITFEHFLSVLADNWHDLQHGSMLRHSEQQRSYLGSSRFPSHPVGLFQSPLSLTSSDHHIQAREAGGGGGAPMRQCGSCGTVLWSAFYFWLFLSFPLIALFDDDLHCMDCYCNCINL